MKKAIHQAYPTLIGQFTMTDPERTNHELAKIILEKEKQERTQQFSNVGGWHSQQDLLTWPHQAIDVLRGWIMEAVNDMINATLELMRASGMPRTARGSLRSIAWANVSRYGNYHRVHNHPGACWSGAYYVQGGDVLDESKGGLLELLDPRPYVEMVPTPGDPYGQRITLKPEAGNLVVFPSWLYHSVTPFFGSGERISISFNVSAHAER